MGTTKGTTKGTTPGGQEIIRAPRYAVIPLEVDWNRPVGYYSDIRLFWNAFVQLQEHRLSRPHRYQDDLIIRAEYLLLMAFQAQQLCREERPLWVRQNW